MGEKKVKQYNRQQYLEHNPFCYCCGAAATTTDHIPTRAYFTKRKWPEGYEFPCCYDCNQETRIDELVVAFLFNLRVTGNSHENEKKLLTLAKGLKNNAPDILEEWQKSMPISDEDTKKSLDEFGPIGAELYKHKFISFDIGPLTQEKIKKFATKLIQALYYKHTGQILEGSVWLDFYSFYRQKKEIFEKKLEDILSVYNDLAVPKREDKTLEDQFFYRYRADNEHGALTAIIVFSDQFIFHTIAYSDQLMTKLIEKEGLKDIKLDLKMHQVQLKYHPDGIHKNFPHIDFQRKTNQKKHK